jgi:hypothetical protein
MEIEIKRVHIENRAVRMAEAFAVENEAMSDLWADADRQFDLLQGMRFGAMAAIEILREAT